MSTYNCRGAINGIIVQNNPVNFIDPEGESFWAPWVGLGAGLASAAWNFGVEYGLSGGDLKKAGQAALVGGVTTAVGVGVASTGAGVPFASLLSMETNSLMQIIVYGKVNAADVLISGIGNTPGGFAASRALKNLAIKSKLGALGRGYRFGLYSSLGSTIFGELYKKYFEDSDCNK